MVQALSRQPPTQPLFELVTQSWFPPRPEDMAEIRNDEINPYLAYTLSILNGFMPLAEVLGDI